MDRQAVSPVIATLLMLAITVVLAAGIYYIIQPENPRSHVALVGFSDDEVQDRLAVSSVQKQSRTWASYGFRITGCDQPGGANGESMIVHVGTSPTPFYNEAAANNGAALNEASTGLRCGSPVEQLIGDANAFVVAGQAIHFCVGPTTLTAGATSVVLSIRDIEANQIMYEHTFAAIAVCNS